MNYSYNNLSSTYADNSAFAVGDDGKFQPISHRQTHQDQHENNIYGDNNISASSAASSSSSSSSSSTFQICSGDQTQNHTTNNTSNKSYSTPNPSEEMINFAKNVIGKYNKEQNMETIYEKNATIVIDDDRMSFSSNFYMILQLFPNIRRTNIKVQNVKLDGNKIFINWTNGYYDQLFIVNIQVNNNLSVEYHQIMSVKTVFNN